MKKTNWKLPSFIVCFSILEIGANLSPHTLAALGCVLCFVHWIKFQTNYTNDSRTGPYFECLRVKYLHEPLPGILRTYLSYRQIVEDFQNRVGGRWMSGAGHRVGRSLDLQHLIGFGCLASVFGSDMASDIVGRLVTVKFFSNFGIYLCFCD